MTSSSGSSSCFTSSSFKWPVGLLSSRVSVGHIWRDASRYSRVLSEAESACSRVRLHLWKGRESSHPCHSCSGWKSGLYSLWKIDRFLTRAHVWPEGRIGAQTIPWATNSVLRWTDLQSHLIEVCRAETRDDEIRSSSILSTLDEDLILLRLWFTQSARNTEPFVEKEKTK